MHAVCSQLPTSVLFCSPQTNCDVVAVCTPIQYCCCNLHPNTVQTATIHYYHRKQLIQVLFSVLTVAVRTLILYCADCNNRTGIGCGMQQQHSKCTLCVCTVPWLVGGVSQAGSWGGGGDAAPCLQSKEYVLLEGKRGGGDISSMSN